MELRISTTTVDAFRLFTTSDWFTEEKLVNQITGKFESSPAMNFGTAYHRLIEHGFENGFALLNKNGIVYAEINPESETDSSIITPALEFRNSHPLITNEIKMTKQFRMGEYDITLVGQCDGLEGMIAHEHKTGPTADYDKYADSYQWRFYCEIFGVDIVQYNIFQLLGSDYAMKKAQTDTEFFNCIEGVKLHEFRMNRYPELSKDCLAMLADFTRFVQIKNLESNFIK